MSGKILTKKKGNEMKKKNLVDPTITFSPLFSKRNEEENRLANKSTPPLVYSPFIPPSYHLSNGLCPLSLSFYVLSFPSYYLYFN